VIAPRPRFDHIVAMTTENGTFEHALHATPRIEHGFCADDMARVLVVAAREPNRDDAVVALHRIAFRYLIEAQGRRGDCRNRRQVDGRWRGRRTVEDCWGRSLWAFGTAAARAEDDDVRGRALAAFDRSAARRAVWLRSVAFAALGSVEVVEQYPGHDGAVALLRDAAELFGFRVDDQRWPWPEPRLTYANAAITEAMIATGTALDRPGLVDTGLSLLRWLLDRETHDGHSSPTPAGGSGPDDRAPMFDQQPIEVAAMADACVRAFRLTGDPMWMAGLQRSCAWFLGDNDGDAVMWDPATGGGYDGLTPDGPNLNEGAESTLAFISTMQHAHHLAIVLP